MSTKLLLLLSNVSTWFYSAAVGKSHSRSKAPEDPEGCKRFGFGHSYNRVSRESHVTTAI